jgi:hypothetical protein
MLTKYEVLANSEIFDSQLLYQPDGQGGIYITKMDGRIRNKSTKTVSSLTLKISIYGSDKTLIDTKTVTLDLYPEEVASRNKCIFHLVPRCSMNGRPIEKTIENKGDSAFLRNIMQHLESSRFLLRIRMLQVQVLPDAPATRRSDRAHRFNLYLASICDCSSLTRFWASRNC